MLKQMKETNNKLIANAVGVAPQGDPQTKNIKDKLIANVVGVDSISARKKTTKNTLKEHSNLTSKKGITLIALVITIIVMLILVTVTITVALKGGLFKTAKQATTDSQYHADKEMLLSAVIGATNNAEVDFTKLDANLPQGFTGVKGEYTSKAGNTFYVDSNGNITDEKVVTPGPQVTVDGKTVTLTRDNVAKYLGREVTNYKKDYDTNPTETVPVESGEYTVSTKYRLYYVDFDNKYKDGEGTIYLKADVPDTGKYSLPTTETTPVDPTTTDAIKIKNLNPGLYNQENENGLPIADKAIEPPNSKNDNMKAVTWLTNTNNWNDLKSNLNGINESDINYVIGAPSLEMMMDSYNTHYKNDIDNFSGTPDFSNIEPGERRKLFYQYNSGSSGYKVGPCAEKSSAYYYYTSYNSVYTDSIDSMYYGKYYWLASPSANNASDVMLVAYSNGGFVASHSCKNHSLAFCPLVSLKSSVQLKLK